MRVLALESPEGLRCPLPPFPFLAADGAHVDEPPSPRLSAEQALTAAHMHGALCGLSGAKVIREP